MNTKIKSAAMMLAAVAAFIAVVWSIGTAGAHVDPDFCAHRIGSRCVDTSHEHQPAYGVDSILPGLGVAFHFGPADICSTAASGLRKAGRAVAAYVTIDTDSDYADLETTLRSLRVSQFGFEALQSSIPRTSGASAVCVLAVVPAAT